MIRLTAAQLDDLKSRNPVADVAGESVRLKRQRRVNGFTHAGPCPVCSRDGQARDDARFECNDESWVCAVCADGGDVIRLVMKRDGLDFPAAVARLGGIGAMDAATGALRQAERERVAAERAAAAARYRERERARLFNNFWMKGAAWPGSPVEDYLRARGLAVPQGARLKYLAAMPYFADGREDKPLLIHNGPAMLAAIMRPADGPAFVFCGLHITWLDPAAPKGKAVIRHPDSGDILPAKKMRGTKAGGYIDLGHGGCGALVPDRLFVGEGIETTLAVYTALTRAARVKPRDAFRAAGDLGNIGGRAIATLCHPVLKDAAGRARRVPGHDPDLSSPAMPVPDGVSEIVILGDGDSDPVTTRAACERARKRHARSGRVARVVFADDGADFNDMLSGDETGHE